MDDVKPYAHPCDMCKKPVLMDAEGFGSLSRIRIDWYDVDYSQRSAQVFDICLECREKLLKVLRTKSV